MKNWMAAIAACLAIGGGTALAQAASGTPAAGHRMDRSAGAGNSDGALHHRFNDAGKWAKVFDDPARDKWQKPKEVVDALGLKPGSIVADIGAGTGYFAARIARRVPEGKVFAADIEPDMVRYLAGRAGRKHLDNLVPVQAGTDAASLPEPADVILVVDTYHHIGNRTQYFSKLKASLRPGGRLVIIDFKPDAPGGPHPRHRIPPEKAVEELGAAGYTLAETHNMLPRQYFLVFRIRGS
jgi:SAM-dependent methyltransferase